MCHSVGVNKLLRSVRPRLWSIFHILNFLNFLPTLCHSIDTGPGMDTPWPETTLTNWPLMSQRDGVLASDWLTWVRETECLPLIGWHQGCIYTPEQETMGAALQQQNRQCIIISLEELSLEEKVNVLVLDGVYQNLEPIDINSLYLHKTAVKCNNIR